MRAEINLQMQSLSIWQFAQHRLLTVGDAQASALDSMAWAGVIGTLIKQAVVFLLFRSKPQSQAKPAKAPAGK
jgi:hypothetical protein